MRLAVFTAMLASMAAAQTYPFIPIKGPQQLGAILQDHRGLLWVGSNSGIYISDGQHMFPLSLSNLPQTIYANDFAEAPDGSIWVAGAQEGLYRVDTLTGETERIIEGSATSIVARKNGVLLAGIGPTGHGVPDLVQLYEIRKRASGWQKSLVPGVQVRRGLTIDSTGAVLFGCPEGWCELDRSDHVTRHAFRGFSPARVLRDSQNCTWFRDEHVVAYQCGARDPQLVPEVSGPNGLSQLSELEDGSMLIVSNGLIAIGRPGRFRSARFENGLPAGSLNAARSRDGTLFIAGDSGLFRWPWPFQLEYWGRDAGVNDPGAILGMDGRMFIASAPGISELKDGHKRWTRITPGTMYVLALISAGKRSMYATVTDRMLREISLEGRILRQGPPNSGPTSRVAETPDGRLWISGPGILRVRPEGSRLVPETVVNGEPHFGQDVRVDPKGRIWGCYSGGIAYLDGTEWKHITTQDGLIQDKCRSMTFGPDGDLWYGYNTAQAFARVHIDSGGHAIVRNFTAGGEIGDPGVHFLDTDRRGWIWRGGSNGVYIATSAQADNGQWLRLSEMDGLPENMTNQRSFFADPDGSVWFGTASYVVHFRPPPDLLTRYSVPPPFFTVFSVDGKPPVYARSPDAIPSHNNLVLFWGTPE